MSKQLKKQWHLSMRQRAFEYANKICKQCQETTSLKGGVIHHTAYPVGVYERCVEKLIDEGICEWLCRLCHEKVHLALDFDETRGNVRNAGFCNSCGKIAYGGWDRGRGLGDNDEDICICKSCLKKRRSREKKEQAGQLRLF